MKTAIQSSLAAAAVALASCKKSNSTGITTQNDYAKIDGLLLWIEYACQNGVILSDTHPHAVWCNKTKDYGGK